MFRLIAPPCFAFALLLLACHPAAASVWYVDPDGSGDFPDIRSAIAGAAPEDSILLGDGIFMGENNRNLDFQGKTLVIRSVGGTPDHCTIDCEGMSRAFRFSHQEGPTCALEGIQIIHGWVQGQGGAILCENGSGPTIRACRFRDNNAVGAYAYGGAIAAQSNSVVNVHDSEFINNEAQVFGGAVSCRSGGRVTLASCLLSGNVAVEGGAVEVFHDAVAKLDRCTLHANDAIMGGATACWGGSTLGVSHCTFSENTADDASAICCPEGTGYGPCPIIVDHSIIFGGSVRPIFCGSTSVFTIACTDMSGNAGSDWSSCTWDMVGHDGNFSSDPLFCGGSEPWTLRSDSPCAPGHNPECGLIGAWPVGCYGPAGVEETRAERAARDVLQLYSGGPNPGRGAFRLLYVLPGAMAGADVRLAVHDAAGRLIRTLVAEAGSAGLHSVLWDGVDDGGQRAAPGAYFCRLTSGGVHATTRIVLLP